MSLSAIGRKLSLDRRTVRRFARAADVEELLTAARSRTSLLDEFKPYLHDRLRAGCTDAARLTRELVELGYRGSDKTVRRYLQPLRDAHNALPPAAVAPTIRQATGWLTRRPDRLTDDERAQLDALLGRSPALTTTRELVHDFAEIMTDRRGLDLAAWMTAVDAHGEPALRSFVRGLRRDLDAVTAGLTLSHSSGPVEGHVNRIKMLKRQMYGRANLDLLRKRVIHAYSQAPQQNHGKCARTTFAERHHPATYSTDWASA
ncbi:transposase [Rhodococcus opacus]|nr:transposase [Rhodococcus opacus]